MGHGDGKPGEGDGGRQNAARGAFSLAAGGISCKNAAMSEKPPVQVPGSAPRVSVVVPVYNVLPWLDRCLESLRTQTFRDFETILVDDGSTDGCAARCDEWVARLPRCKVVHQPNGGLANARNSGIATASGEWVACVDSDDYVAPDYLAYLLDLAESNGVSLAACQCVQTTGGPLPDDAGVDSAGVEVSRDRTESCAWLQEGTRLTDTIWGKIYRRELLLSIPHPDGRVHEDTAIIGRLVYAAGRIAVGHRAPYGYFVNEGSIIHTPGRRRLEDQLWANLERVRFYREVREPALERMAWEKLAKAVLWDIKTDAMPVADLRAFCRKAGMPVAGPATAKCRIALRFPRLYRLESRLKGFLKRR